jgi:hypothetical protein
MIRFEDILPVTVYRARRAALRAEHMAERRARTAALGERMRLQFENEHTVRYQIQEALRIEGGDDPAAVRAEIDAYTPLLPRRGEWRATLMIEIPEPRERALALPCLSAAAHRVYVACGGVRVVAEANEDLPDRHLARPSAVHFLRFALPPAFRRAARGRAPILVGCAHPAYPRVAPLPEPAARRLRAEAAPYAPLRLVHKESA